jgi:conjugal transfer pilus assembly protein TraW
MLLIASAGASASDAMLDGIDAVVEQARRIEGQAQQAPRPAWLEGEPVTEAQRRAIESIARDAARIEEAARTGDVAETLGIDPASEPSRAASTASRYRIEILVSWALGEEALREIAAEVSAYPNAVMIFRGIPEGQRFGNAIKRLHALLTGLDPVPSVTIDPPRFERLGADRVPAIAVYAGGEPIAHARGTYGIRHMLARVRAGARGDLGAIGPTVTVTEPNLIEVMKQRLASLDLTASQRRAAERYWGKLQYLELPQATEPRSRRFDPSVLVTADIKDARGNVVAAAGSRINPLDLMPFHERLLVFDASRPEQVALARELAARHRDRRLVLIASRLDRAAGWDGFKRLQDGFRAPVYLLNEPIRARFHIERVPALIDAEGKDIVVREIPPRNTE